jgi:hypothetical protein
MAGLQEARIVLKIGALGEELEREKVKEIEGASLEGA